MTPEERFERIEKTLDRMAAESNASRAEHEARFRRIETNMELLQDFMSQSAQRFEQRLEQLGQRVDQTSRDVSVVADAVLNLVRLFERHTRNGHGGNGGGGSE